MVIQRTYRITEGIYGVSTEILVGFVFSSSLVMGSGSGSVTLQLCPAGLWWAVKCLG